MKKIFEIEWDDKYGDFIEADWLEEHIKLKKKLEGIVVHRLYPVKSSLFKEGIMVVEDISDRPHECK